jgi:hypothetical protein
VEEHDLSYPVIPDADATALKQYGSGSVPYTVIIDRNLKVRYSGNDFEENQFLKIIADLMK